MSGATALLPSRAQDYILRLMRNFTDEVERFLTEHGMAPSAFGNAALGDYGFVRGLRHGRSPRLVTVQRVRAWMGEFVRAKRARDRAAVKDAIAKEKERAAEKAAKEALRAAEKARRSAEREAARQEKRMAKRKEKLKAASAPRRVRERAQGSA